MEIFNNFRGKVETFLWKSRNIFEALIINVLQTVLYCSSLFAFLYIGVVLRACNVHNEIIF